MPQASMLSYFRPTNAVLEKEQIAFESAGLGKTEDSSNLQNVKERSTDALLPVPLERSTILGHLKTEPSRTDTINYFIPPSCPAAIIVKVQPGHLQQIKQLTSTLLPIRYPDRFFNDCLNDALLADVSRVVLFDSKPVGWIRSRLDPGEDGMHELYVQTLGVLAPWRGMGLASALLDQITQPALVQRHGIALVSAHVWQDNEDALEWYEKRGFRRVRLEQHYYRRLRPAGAWVVQKQIS